MNVQSLLCLIAIALPLAAEVPFTRILNAEKEPGNWLTYSGNYAAHRYSSLDQINEGNVAKLKASCTSRRPQAM
jgi:alcohol dehydrogenase (cytochrome c)